MALAVEIYDYARNEDRIIEEIPRRESRTWRFERPKRFISPCWKAELRPRRSSDSPPHEAEFFAARFRNLADQWRSESKHMSSTKSMSALDSYQQIIKMDKPVVALLLLELKERPNFWFTALRQITGEKEIGRGLAFKEAVNAWIKWGYDNSYLHEGPS
jgi:hypothetical protein